MELHPQEMATLQLLLRLLNSAASVAVASNQHFIQTTKMARCGKFKEEYDGIR